METIFDELLFIELDVYKKAYNESVDNEKYPFEEFLEGLFTEAVENDLLHDEFKNLVISRMNKLVSINVIDKSIEGELIIVAPDSRAANYEAIYHLNDCYRNADFKNEYNIESIIETKHKFIFKVKYSRK